VLGVGTGLARILCYEPGSRFCRRLLAGQIPPAEAQRCFTQGFAACVTERGEVFSSFGREDSHEVPCKSCLRGVECGLTGVSDCGIMRVKWSVNRHDRA
jgi:hypothetical protein